MPDPSAIHQLGIDFDAAWNRRDAAAVGGLFVDDADLQVPRGDMLRGREQIEQYYTSGFANMPPIVAIASRFSMSASSQVMFVSGMVRRSYFALELRRTRNPTSAFCSRA